MKELVPYLIVGITSGSVYALAGVGLVLTFKTSGIFNFGHGALAAFGAYALFEFRDRMGWPWPAAGLTALILVGLLGGLLLELLARALARVPTAARVAATVGLLVSLQGALVAIFGAQTLELKSFLPTRLYRLGDVNLSADKIIVTLFVLASVTALYVFLQKSRTGVNMMAVVDDPTLLSLQGTDPSTVRRYSWMIGSTFAALSGMLLAPTIGLDAAILTLLVFYAFGAAAVGAFNSLPLTYAGGLAIGMTSELMKKFINTGGPVAALPSMLPFLVLFVGLLVIPRNRLMERGNQVVRPPVPSIEVARSTRTAILLGAGLIMLFAPHFDPTRLPLLMTALAYAILFLSLGLLVRTSGQISLCQMGFAAVGASTFAHAVDHGVPWLVAVLIGGLVAVPVGALVAIPAIRLSGVYLAIATFGFGLLMQKLFYSSFLMFGNYSQILTGPRPEVVLVSTDTETGYYYVLLTVTLVCCGFVVMIRNGRLGRLLRGLAAAPHALDAHGLSSNVTRVWVFCVSAFIAGVGGAVLGPVTGSVTGSSFEFGTSLLLVAVSFIAGRQPIAGSFVASGLLIVVPGYISDAKVTTYTPVAFGVLAITAACISGFPVLARLASRRQVLERAATSPARARLALSARGDA